MSATEVFFDTNVLLYLLSADADKAERAETLLQGGGHISVQVLNEFTSAATRKLKLSWAETSEVLGIVRAVCEVSPITVETHDRALHLAERYQFGFYDALIVASALISECRTLYSEDLQSGQRVAGALRVVNPFQ
jgi:predicted nucleic acid-binding protein